MPLALSSPLDRVAAFLRDEGHSDTAAAAMAANLCEGAPLPAKTRQAIRPCRDLTMTPGERDKLAWQLLARRVLMEGVLLSLTGDTLESAVQSAHRLVETREAARRGTVLSLGGNPASRDQVKAARERVAGEIAELDVLVEAATRSPAALSRINTAAAQPNPRVTHVQNTLNRLGFRVQPDGQFGPVTEEAVKDFQSRAGLEASGAVDDKTVQALRNGMKGIGGVGQPGLYPSGPGPAPAGAKNAPKGSAQGETGNSVPVPGKQPVPETNKSVGDKKQRSVSVKVNLGESLTESKLTSKERDALPSSAFVFPKDRAYPIHDRGHARAALSMGAKHESGAKLAKIRAAVHAKYPDLAKDVKESADLSEGMHLEIHLKDGRTHLHRVHGGAGVARRLRKRMLADPDVHKVYIREAAMRADMPEAEMSKVRKCPTCGALVKGAVCQRGHRVDMKALREHDDDLDGLSRRDVKAALRDVHESVCGCGAASRDGQVCLRGHRLDEAWSEAARRAALLARRRGGSKRSGDMLHPHELKPGIQFDRDGAGGGPFEVVADKGDKWGLKDLDDGSEFDHPKSDFPAPYKASTYKGIRGLHYVGTRGASDDVTRTIKEAWSPQARAAAAKARKEKRLASMPEGLNWNKRKGALEGKYNGVPLERGVAYQGELAGGDVFTGHWTGEKDVDGEPIFRHVDTGDRRTFRRGKFYGRLADVADRYSVTNDENPYTKHATLIDRTTGKHVARGMPENLRWQAAERNRVAEATYGQLFKEGLISEATWNDLQG